MNIDAALGQKTLLAFKGKEKPSDEIIHALRMYQPGGITLFRSHNLDNPAQIRELTASLQKLAREFGLPGLLIATDQEGGQLMAVGAATQLPGNMALGATGSTELARKAGEVLGREMAALGINVDYAPCADVNINPQNPVVGTRSFGEDPQKVGELAVAMLTGIQSQGVAAVAKHFPGHGDVASDSHHGLPSVPHSLERLRQVEFVPFKAAIQAGVKIIMTAHLAIPAVDGPDAPPSTLSPTILKKVLRDELKFDGLIITDAMDMHAIRQGEFLGADALRAVNAGDDLLLLTTDPIDQERVHSALIQAAQQGQLDSIQMMDSASRILALKEWLFSHTQQPDLSVINCSEHQKIADEIAEQSITLVRDQANLLPIRLKADQRLAVVIPKPENLTPADTSSYVVPALAASFRAYHPNVDEFSISSTPSDAEISTLLGRLKNYPLVILGTINAAQQAGQQTLVRETLKAGIPTIVAALRLPYDLASFPEAPTYVCAYSILEPSMHALAKALFGQIEFKGRLPVSIPGMYKRGFGISK
jgi:beta-N-acetylhexosaminidase